MARERAEACAESLWVARISAKAGEVKVSLSSIASAVATVKQSGLDVHQLNIILKVDVQVIFSRCMLSWILHPAHCLYITHF